MRWILLAAALFLIPFAVQPQELPVATPDSVTLPADVTDAVIDVGANDVAVSDGSILTTVTIKREPQHGRVHVLEFLKVVYVPPRGFVGNDGFLYELHDDRGRTASAEVFVEVEAPEEQAPFIQCTDVRVCEPYTCKITLHDGGWLACPEQRCTTQRTC